MGKIAITNVRIFNGKEALPLNTVVIDGEFIVSLTSDVPDTSHAELVDGKGGTLLPGLIDAHIHLHGPSNLREMASWGITTALDMATFDHSLLVSLRELIAQGGVTDIRSPGLPACAPGSAHSQIPAFRAEDLVKDRDEARKFVEDRVKEGVDYIKIIADLPGFDQETLDALVQSAKQYDKRTIAHAAHYDAFPRLIQAGVDFITHVPLDKALDPELCEAMKQKGIVSIPTLIMMHGVAKNRGKVYPVARESVANLHRAGVMILVGTDSNMQPGVPANVKHGEGMHEEMELLVAAGLSVDEVLRGATSEVAGYFGLADRGMVEVGMRADLLLVEGDLLGDIRESRKIVKVWCRGVEVERA